MQRWTEGMRVCEKQLELVEAINNYFGCDAAYFDVDAFTLAKRIMEAGWEKPVRCKDCYKQNTSWCPMDSKRMRVSGYCSYGERRSE